MYVEEVEQLCKEERSPLLPYRKKALARLRAMGFPDRRVEEYRKISLAPLTHLSFSAEAGAPIELQKKVPAGVVSSTIEEAFVIYAGFMHNRLEKRVREEEDFFALAAEAMPQEGCFLYVPPKSTVSLPIEIFKQYRGRNRHVATKIQLIVGKESRCELICESRGEGFLESAALEMLDIVVEKGAECHITDLSFVPKEALFLRSLRGLVKEGGKLTYVNATKGSSLYRLHYQVELSEKDAACDLQGVWYLKEERKAHFSGEVKHLAPHTKSNQHFKGVLLDKSRSTFTGKIFVASPAQKTEAYQLNNNLVLGEGAHAFTKPHLEIFADDVKATHGATISQLSEEELFYMRSRGYKETLAREVLMKGFLEEILRAIPHPAVASEVRKQYDLSS